MHRLLCFTALLGLMAPAAAQSPLATPFAHDAVGAVGGAVYFTLSTAVPVELTRLDLNVGAAAGTPGSVDVYIGCLDSSAMPLDHLGLWAGPVSSGSGYAAGIDQPTACALRQPIHLLPGVDYPIALVLRRWAHAYATGQGAAAVAATAELTLEAGGASDVPFAGQQRFPRLWQGAVHYTTSPTSPPVVLDCAERVHYGEGCYRGASSVYEDFADLRATFDLAGAAGAESRLVFTARGPQGYAVLHQPGVAAWTPPVGPPVASIGGGLMGDDSVSTPLALPFAFPYYAGTTASSVTTVHATSNGYLVIGAAGGVAADHSPTVAELLTTAGDPQCGRICAAWADWHVGRNRATQPSAGVYFHADPNGQAAYVTWLEVGEFANATPGASRNSFQVVLHRNGDFEVRYGRMDRATGRGPVVVGWSHGDSAAASATDPGRADLSAARLAGQLVTQGPDAVPLALTSDHRPRLGTTLRLITDHVPAASLATITMVANGVLTPSQELGRLGMPGCLQHIRLIGADMVVQLGSPVVERSLLVPSDPSFSGLFLFAQSLSLVPGVNAFGGLTSNGLRLRVGAL